MYQLLKYMQYRLGVEYHIEIHYDNGNLVVMVHSNEISYARALPKHEIIDNAWNPFYDETIVNYICKECAELKETIKKRE